MECTTTPLLFDDKKKTNLKEREKTKYQTIWKHERYRKFSPGERVVDRFQLIALFRDIGVKSVMDAGCGSGKLLRKLIEAGKGEFDVKGFDIAENCLDPYFDDIKDKLLKIGVLWDINDFNEEYDAILCTDVLEHIPPEKIPLVLKNLFTCSRKFCFLGIALIPDSCGPGLVGEPLHLTVKPAIWWLKQIKSSGFADIRYLVDKDESDRDFWLHVFLLKKEKKANVCY
jgi:SAM-dependent methyltransferase